MLSIRELNYQTALAFFPGLSQLKFAFFCFFFNQVIQKLELGKAWEQG